MGAVSGAEGNEHAPALEVRRGHPSDDELAALLAVVGEAYTAEPSNAGSAAPTRSRWQQASRGLRTPLPRERGWGGFGG